MYYDEQVINGVLCHRGTPNGEWIPCTAEQLTLTLQEVKAAEQQRALDVALQFCRECKDEFGHSDNCIGCPNRPASNA